MGEEEYQVNNPEPEPTADGGQAGEETAPANEEGQSKDGTDASGAEQPSGDSAEGEKGKEDEKITPEQYKKLQAEFTKKSQMLSNWEKLGSTKEFQEWYGNMAKQGQQPQQQFDPNSLGPEEKKAYDLITNHMVNPAVTSAMNQMKQYVQPFVDYVVNAQIGEFYSKYPDAKSHENEVADIMLKHGLTMEKAWKFLKADSAKEDAKQEVYNEISAKEDANLQRPGGVKTSKPAIKKGMSLKEIAKITSEEMGVDW
jgi:hypothetical protein